MNKDPTGGEQFAHHAIATLSAPDKATTVGVVGHREYTEDSIDSEFWREVFGADISASPPKRIGEGQVGMNLRFALASDDASVPASVVVKMASPDPTSRATGIGLRNYEREVKFYNEVATSLDVRTPHCYFADWNEAGGDIAIVLEDMSPSEQGDQIRGCTIEEARLAVTELSRLHGPRWNDPTLFNIDWLQRRDAEDGARLHGLYSLFKPGFLGIYNDAILAETGKDGLDFVNQTPGHGNGVGDLAYFIGAGLLPDDRRKHEWELVDLYIAGIESFGHAVDHEWIKDHYRKEAISGLVMAVIASQIVGRTERGDKMFEVMATRHIIQGLENGALSLL